MLTRAGGLNVVAYAAAKHGVQGMIKAFSNGWAAKGVCVNAIAPGYIATDVSQRLPPSSFLLLPLLFSINPSLSVI